MGVELWWWWRIVVAKEVGVYLAVAYEEGAATGVHSLYASRVETVQVHIRRTIVFFH